MTRSEILAMPAGPEMDRLVATLLLGCKIREERRCGDVWIPKLKDRPIVATCWCPGHVHGVWANGDQHECEDSGDSRNRDHTLLPFSSAPGPAFEVVYAMAEAGWLGIVNDYRPRPGSQKERDTGVRGCGCDCRPPGTFELQVQKCDPPLKDGRRGIAFASFERNAGMDAEMAACETLRELPLAICRAALLTTVPSEKNEYRLGVSA